MAGLADLLYLGQPDPARQLAMALAGRQQPQPPQGGPPPGPAPGPADPNAPAPNAQPVNADPNAPAPNPAPGQPAPPNSAPQPQALQSTPDMAASYQTLANPPNLMSLYLQLQQRQSASDQINRGLALITANHSPPSMREAIMQSLTGGGQDAGQTVGNLMSLYQGQQQMAANQQLLAQSPDIATKLGMPEGVVRAEIMAGRGAELMRGLEPTDMARNYAWAHDTYAKAHPGASPDEIDQGAQGILLGMGGGGGDSATRSWRAAKIQWDQNPATKGTPYPWGGGAEDNPTSFAAWQGAQKAEETKQTEDQQEAAGKLPTYVQNLTGARNKIADIIGLQPGGGQDPAKKALLQSIIGNPFAQSYVNGEPGVGREWTAWWSGLSQEQKQVLNDIKEATDPNTLIGGLGKRAPKRGAADVNDITSGLSGLRDVTKGYDHWLDGAIGTVGAIDTATANAYGASGQADNAPENVKDRIDPTYLYGGKLYPKGAHPLPIPPDQLTATQAQIKGAPNPEMARQNAIKYFLARNFDPTPLKNMGL
jgi:hypothetical protein